MDDIKTPTLEQMEALVKEAEQMRADAIRTSFKSFVASIWNGVEKLRHALAIPRTEQL